MLSHHALLLVTNNISREVALAAYGDNSLVDVITYSYKALGIDDVRNLTQVAYQKPLIKDRQLIIVLATTIGHEAEQALLKLLEEPPTTTQFLFVVGSNYQPTPTLASRFHKLSSPAEDHNDDLFESFRHLGYTERIDKVAERLEKKDLEWQQQMKTGLVNYLSQAKLSCTKIERDTLYFIAEHIGQRGSSPKMLFELLSLTLPLCAVR